MNKKVSTIALHIETTRRLRALAKNIPGDDYKSYNGIIWYLIKEHNNKNRGKMIYE